LECSHEDCKKVFKTSRRLKEHENGHNRISVFLNLPCELCGRCFKNSGALKKHHLTHSIASFPCTLCGKKVKTKGSLESHMLTHNSRKIYQCDKCPRQYPRNDTLKRHMKIIHVKMRPYPCDKCDKSFFQKVDFSNHKEVHLNLQLNCRTCSKVFSTKRFLADHERYHTTKQGRKEAECNICQKKLFDENSLKRHNKLVHEDFKPFECSICQKRFAIIGLLNSHKKDVHSEMLKCPRCPRTFRKEHLKDHILRSHSGELRKEEQENNFEYLKLQLKRANQVP